MTIAETLRNEGRDEGRNEGRRENLLMLLQHRFGAVPSEVAVRVARAEAAQLDTWTRAILTAQSLAEMFATPAGESHPPGA